jgi:hypothetical protein
MFIQIVPDRFRKSEASLANQLATTRSNEAHVRRPTNGIVLKEETFATLRVVAGNNKPITVVDAGSRRPNKDAPEDEGGKRKTDIYSNFLLQNVQEERVEKQQILETFGEPYIFLFGERARVMTFTGVLMNTFDFNWEAEWWYNYENYLRGTRCVEMDARVYLAFDETLVGGYIIGSQAQKNSTERHHVNFQFQMFVTSYTNFSKIGEPWALPGIKAPTLKKVSDEQDAVWRPKTIDSETMGILLDQQQVQDLTLFQGLSAYANAALSAWQTAEQTSQYLLQRLSDAVNPTVGVPVGFAGALEFDSDQVSVTEVKSTGEVMFSVFSANDEEYVGRSSHYGSSITDDGAIQYQFGNVDSLLDTIERGQRVVDKAVQLWTDEGYGIPPDQLAAVSEVLTTLGTGLVQVGASREWRLAQDAVLSSVKGSAPEALQRIQKALPVEG